MLVFAYEKNLFEYYKKPLNYCYQLFSSSQSVSLLIVFSTYF